MFSPVNSENPNFQKYMDTMMTKRSAAEYNMRHKSRGMALIFNHKFFAKLATRNGTDVDCANLECVLRQLDFRVRVYPDYKYEQILSAVKEAASLDHTDNDCIMVVILSHGEMGVISAYDMDYSLESIWSCFTPNNCPSLANKPKLFFIQACRGSELDSGTELKRIETDGDGSIKYKIPTHADFLTAYSTMPGYYSWRNTVKGSWFIQSLCAELEENGKQLDLLTLLTFV
ncbi:Damm, partial [Drosophila busckii]